jgi:phage-related protein
MDQSGRKDFEEFPLGARQDIARALTIIAEGGHPDIAKPLTGFGSNGTEAPGRRVPRRVRAAKDDIWIVHAQKKSKCGISTPKAEIDLIRERTMLALMRYNAAYAFSCRAVPTQYQTR